MPNFKVVTGHRSILESHIFGSTRAPKKQSSWWVALVLGLFGFLLLFSSCATSPEVGSRDQTQVQDPSREKEAEEPGSSPDLQEPIQDLGAGGQEPSEAAPGEKQVGVAPSATTTPLIWQLERNGVTLTLFGSVHLARKDIFPLPEAILESFHQADELVVEVDLSAIDPAELQKITLDAITLPQGSSLLQILPPEVADQVTRALQKYPLPPGFANSLAPWALEQLLITMAAAETGIGTEQGVDSYFLQQALISDKSIRQLETMEQQLGFFQQLPMDLHIASLQHTLSNLPDIPQQMEQLLNAWKRGDRGQVETLIFEDWHEGDFDNLLNQVLLEDRNRDWLTQIETLATQEWSSGQEIFIVVGLGHLIGDTGLPTLLQERGFRSVISR